MTETRKRINYTVACVSEFSKRYGISPKEAFLFLYEYRAIEHYDIEHTLSFADAVEDMMIICRNNGGELK